MMLQTGVSLNHLSTVIAADLRAFLIYVFSMPFLFTIPCLTILHGITLKKKQEIGFRDAK
jgi:hypothetical protein